MYCIAPDKIIKLHSTKPGGYIISDESQAKESETISTASVVQEASRPTAFPTGPIATEAAAEANGGAERADGGGVGGGRRSVAAALNAGIAPTASPESPSPTEQNLPRVLWDRPPGRAGAAANEVGPRPPTAPGQAGPECSPPLPLSRRTDLVVQRGAEKQSEISKFHRQTFR